VWIAAPAALFVVRTPLAWPLVYLALSGAACLLQRIVPEPRPTQAIDPKDLLQLLRMGYFSSACAWG
jgi:hypothetical protein